MARRIGDGQCISGGFSWRKVETAGMRGPDFSGGRIQGDDVGVGDVVAKLGLFAAMHDGGRNV